MRVLQVCSAEGIGGGEVHVASLASGLVDRGIDVEFAVRPTSSLPQYVAEREPNDYPWHALSFRNALDLASIRGLARLIEESAVDIVHAHVARDYPIAGMAVASSRARLVLTRHHYLPMKGNALYRRLVGRAQIIAVSESVRKTVVESLRIAPDRVTTIWNWIDVERFEKPRDRSAERHRLGITRRVAVALVGQLTPLKGQEEFLRAVALVAAERSDVEFLIVGEDRDPGAPFERRIKRLARDLGIESVVRFLPHQDDLPGLLYAVDAVAVPSWNEAFSLVAAEAMASGRTVIASNAGALPELIEDNRTGLLVPPRDPEKLAAAMLRTASDPAAAEQLGRAAKLSAARFSRDASIDAVVAVYQRALSES